MIKAECATVNEALGVITAPIARAIQQAADEIVAGEMADQFPVDVFQTGSGTSTNMLKNPAQTMPASSTKNASDGNTSTKNGRINT